MRASLIDFSSWSSVLSTVLSLLLITLLMVGIRLLFMQTIQRRRERENRQINERLKTLIAAYKTLGSSFTGQLRVNPVHLRDLHATAREGEATAVAAAAEVGEGQATDLPDDLPPVAWSSERQRRTRDAVEAALSDVILLGTEEQVRLAAQAAHDMVAGRHIETAALVASLRHFIRAALDLEPVPDSIAVPSQGPARPGGPSGSRRDGAAGSAGAAARGGGGAGGGGVGGGAGMGVGLGMGGLRRGDGVDPD